MARKRRESSRSFEKILPVLSLPNRKRKTTLSEINTHTESDTVFKDKKL